MENSFVYKNDRPWPNKRLKRAAIVGHTTATSVRLWFRFARPGNYVVLLYPHIIGEDDAIYTSFKTIPYQPLFDQLPKSVRKIPVTIADYGQDTTATLDVDKLKPLTEYRYAVYGEDETKVDDNAPMMRILLGQDLPYGFRTLPDKDAPLSFAFYTCHMPYKKTLFGSTAEINMQMWDCLNAVLERHYAQDLRFIIAGGDQIYADGVDTLDIWKYLNTFMRKEKAELLPSYDSMLSWYRDIYRGYWGFPAVNWAMANFPNYMIWDDHELGDGWGSYILTDGNDKKDELLEIFPNYTEKNLKRADCLELLDRMRNAGFKAYEEYQHAHNPPTPKGQYDYEFGSDSVAVYVLDGRGYRDVNRKSKRVLGSAQCKRFINWLENFDHKAQRYLFIVSAVPFLHLTSILANAGENIFGKNSGLRDDLRDAWEHDLHKSERRELLQAIFALAKKGVRVSILSGDVHVSAAFRMVDDATKATIYQLTSSAITYDKALITGWLLGKGVAEYGTSDDGYSFERLALFTDNNFSMVQVNPKTDEVVFRLYALQSIEDPKGIEAEKPIPHAMLRLPLRFD